MKTQTLKKWYQYASNLTPQRRNTTIMLKDVWWPFFNILNESILALKIVCKLNWKTWLNKRRYDPSWKKNKKQSIFRYTLKMLVDFSAYAISSFPHITSSELKVSNWVFPPILLVIFVSIIQKFSHLIMIFTD